MRQDDFNIYSIDQLLNALERRNQALWRAIRKRDNLEWFHNLWKANAPYYDFVPLYNKIRQEIGLPTVTSNYFADNILSRYNLLAPKFKDALQEWAMALVMD